MIPTSNPAAVEEQTPLLGERTEAPIGRDCPLAGTANATKPSPFLICIPVFFSVLTAAMVLGIQQQWLIVFLCSRLVRADGTVLPGLSDYLPLAFNTYPMLQANPDWEQCRAIPDIQASAARWGMTFSLCTGLPALLTLPLYGVLSDRIGRKPLLLMGMVSAVFFYSAYLSISYLQLGLWILIVTALVTGFMGSYFVVLTSTLSYFADTTEASDRGKVFIIGESSFFAGFALGPLLGGIMARRLPHGPTDVFLFSLVCKVVIFIATYLFLPESLVTLRQADAGPTGRSPLQRLRSTMKGVVQVFREAMSPSFAYLMLGLMCIAAAMSGRGVFFFYVSYTFGWDAQDEGQYLLVASGSRMIHMLITYPLLTKMFSKLCSDPKGKARFDLNLIRVGVLVAALGAVMQAFSKKGWYLYMITLVDGIATLANPTIQSLLSSNVPKSSQGLLFSGISFTTQVTGVVFGVIMPSIWATTVKMQFANAFLLVVAMLYFLAGFAVVAGVSSKRILEGRDKAHRAEQTSAEEELGTNDG
ncbi:hypothetical protein HDV03_005351 [Kappamyces sp. JEL0829]|nr:hypothetical protein HDV03_005351 [Kappamyces sp. JEL0829]